MKKFSKLKVALSLAKPGWEAQKKLASIGYEDFRKPKPSSKVAAVLLLLVPNSNDSWDIIYIKRPSNNPHDKHGGQISFPGGRTEENDRSLEDTALRETEEEIGVPRTQIQLLGSLSQVYVFVSDFIVSPYVAFCETLPEFILQESEVAYVIRKDLKELLSTEILTKDLPIRSTVLKNVPYYDLDGETLWGATAMMTAEFLEIYRSILI